MSHTTHRRLAGLATIALALAATGTAAADPPGNGVTGSVGTAQVGPVSATATVDAAADTVTAVAEAPAAVSGSGANQTSGSTGSVQTGGGNSTSDSIARAQSSGVQAAPAVAAAATHRIARASAPARVERTDSRGIAQTVGTVPAARPSSPSAPAATRAAQPPGTSPASFQPQVEARPDVQFFVDPFLVFLLAGQIGTGPNDGSTTDGSLGTVQLGSLSFAPAVVFLLPFLGSRVELGGSSGIDGAGTNSATRSLGTVQAGGGNTADGSVGTVQVGGATVAPTIAVSTPFGKVDVGGASGLAGGSNQASNSTGTVQVGGGNSADGSTGTVQVGGVAVAPTVAASETPAGDVSVGGSSGIPEGGNSANGSTGTVQTGPVAVGRTVGAGGGAAEGTTQATAAASAAGENAGAPSGSGGNDRASSSTSAPVPTRSRGTARTSQRKRHAIGAPRAASRSKLGARALRLTERATTGTLPFTGLDLALFVALGLGLGLAGLRARAFAAR